MIRVLCSFVYCLMTFSMLNADWVAVCKDGSQIYLTPSSSSFEEEKEVYLASFTEAYSTNSQIMSDLQNGGWTVSSFLLTAFSYEERAFRKHSSATAFISAKSMEGKTIGYVSFNNEGASVYVRILAVDPKYWNNGVGSLLLFSSINFWPETRRIHLIARKASTRTVSFYRNNGFSFVANPRGDHNIYCELECMISESKRQKVLSRYTQ